MRLFELGKGQPIHSSAEYPVLYHLCDYIGFAYAIENDAIRSRSYYVSTTWDETMNHVVGKWTALFKLVLDGIIIDTYGAFHYDDYAIEIGSGGKRGKRVSHEEREIGINTREISPLHDYHKGTVLLFDLFSESGLQWLLYRNNGSSQGLFSADVAATRQAICVIKDLLALGKPIWKDKVGNELTPRQVEYLNAVYELRDLPFTKALEELADRFPIVDHWRKAMDRATYVRRHMAPKMVKLINRYFAGRLLRDVDVGVVRKLIERCMKMLRLGNNAEAIIMHKIDTSGILHPTTRAVEWGAIISSMMDGDPETVCETIDFFVEREAARREWWDTSTDDDHMRKHAIHDGTKFGRLNDR